ncbi:SRPBCC family protein [Amycolatopsis suaedae]|uniref:SRPBCC domain-containing protein n=1 Tax=Amycolatopsis suaedae TaxID=2510978 RepID=A0A4Q7J2F3_9PSEU|nr:SRPBCC domain-containing protein [Amycolatopsis suaedae]RZQ60573.1 SRPBCC domain-containing protein [Amycolatopsis suaedae]
MTSTVPESVTITVSRTFDAAAADLFRLWTDPAKFAGWFGSVPERTTVDAKVGGDWNAVMIYEGNEMVFGGRFQEIDEPSRLVLTFGDDPSSEGSPLTVELAEAAGKTTLTVTQVGPLPEDQIEPATEGWNHFLEAMESQV